MYYSSLLNKHNSTRSVLSINNLKSNFSWLLFFLQKTFKVFTLKNLSSRIVSLFPNRVFSAFSDCHWNSGDMFEVGSTIILNSLWESNILHAVQTRMHTQRTKHYRKKGFYNRIMLILRGWAMVQNSVWIFTGHSSVSITFPCLNLIQPMHAILKYNVFNFW